LDDFAQEAFDGARQIIGRLAEIVRQGKQLIGGMPGMTLEAVR
jgi:hypothetical protein